MVPKLLLIVNSDPATAGVGELFLQDIVSAYPPGRLVRYSTIQNRQGERSALWLGCKSVIRTVYSSRWPVLSSLFEWLGYASSNVRKREIEKIIKEEQVDLVWVVLSSGPLIYLAAKIAKGSTSMVSTVLDDPSYFTSNQNLDYFTKKVVQKNFALALQGSKQVSVISESMLEFYAKKFHIKPIILRHGIDEKFVKPWKRKTGAECVNIVFAGSLYAKKEWNTFIEAVERCAGRVANRNILISFIGRFPKFGARKSIHLVILGSMNFSETIQAMSDMDIAYLPYWFSKSKALPVKTSFPGKLSAYAAAGLPIFYHGPLESSVTPFLDKYPFGLACNSLNVDSVRVMLEKIVLHDEYLLQGGVERDSALREELGRTVMLARFFGFIGQGGGDACVFERV